MAHTDRKVEKATGKNRITRGEVAVVKDSEAMLRRFNCRATISATTSK